MRDATPPRGHFLNIVTVGWRGEEGLHRPHCYITAISLAMARIHLAFSTFRCSISTPHHAAHLLTNRNLVVDDSSCMPKLRWHGKLSRYCSRHSALITLAILFSLMFVCDPFLHACVCGCSRRRRKATADRGRLISPSFSACWAGWR